MWRLVTFLATPPSLNPIWAVFFWYLFYLMGEALEAYWGRFRYTLYLLIGYTGTVAAAFLTPAGVASNVFVEATVFLAFAYLNPSFVVSLFFLLPVQIVWLARLTWLALILAAVFGNWTVRLVVVASVANFLIFFGKDILAQIANGRRRMARQARAFAKDDPAYYADVPRRGHHKCRVCGITDRTDPHMEFRYCSKCAGECCYCGEHLKSHDHVTGGPPA